MHVAYRMQQANEARFSSRYHMMVLACTMHGSLLFACVCVCCGLVCHSFRSQIAAMQRCDGMHHMSMREPQGEKRRGQATTSTGDTRASTHGHVAVCCMVHEDATHVPLLDAWMCRLTRCRILLPPRLMRHILSPRLPRSPLNQPGMRTITCMYIYISYDTVQHGMQMTRVRCQ